MIVLNALSLTVLSVSVQCPFHACSSPAISFTSLFPPLQNGGNSTDNVPIITFNPDNIRYEFTHNSDSSSSEGATASTGIAVWMLGAAIGGGLILFILVIVIRRRNNVDNDTFMLKGGAMAAGAADEWMNPLAVKAKRNIAFDNPIYDYLDSMA